MTGLPNLLRRNYKYHLLAIMLLLPISMWLEMMPVAQRFSSFSTTFRSLGQMAGLLGFTLYSINLILITRAKFLDKLFLGLDKVYKDHHNLGSIALILLLFHPVFLSISIMQATPQSSLAFFLPFELDRLDLLTGKTTLYIMALLLIITFYFKLPYHIWKLTHKFLGVIYFVAIIHLLVVSGDVSSNGVLKLYLLLLALLAVTSFIYRAILGKIVAEQKKYLIEKVNIISDKIVEIVLSPNSTKLHFDPGQFVYLKIPKLSQEGHPFSIVSHPASDKLVLIIKKSGDYTNSLSAEIVGQTALLEGPYGNFNYSNYLGKKQVWIAGGIGIAPFLSFAFDLEKRNKNMNIDLFYSVRSQKEAVYLDQLNKIEKRNTNFKVHLYDSSKLGHLNADYMNQFVGDEAMVIFICGPLVMMQDLKKQFIDKGISPANIKTEDYNYR